jgi:peroxiredoxin
VQKFGILLVAVAALMAGLYLSASLNQPTPEAVYLAANSDLVGSYRPDFRLGSSTGEFVTPADFAGKTLLINFWATWCEPCRKEMPMLNELQIEYGEAGLQIIGIALDDVQSVRDFAEKLGITYTILVGEADVMNTNRAYGNVTGMLPFSVLVDKEGVIRWQFAGEIQRDDVSNLLNDLL